MKKNKKLYALTAMAGLTLGSIGIATAVSAEADGVPESTVETSVEDVQAAQNDVVRVQDADGDVETPDGETEGRRRGRGGCNLEAAAEAIGIDEADLRSELDAGATIAEVAASNGVSVDVVIDAMVEQKAERIAAKVDAGRITQAEADEKLAEVEDRITDRVNGESEDLDA